MDVNGWRITSFIFIGTSIILLSISGYIAVQSDYINSISNQCAIYGEDNVRSCGIGCYIKGYGDSLIIGSPQNKPECTCSYPFNQTQ